MELVWKGQRGDPAAINELFTRYIPRMRRVLRIKIRDWQRSRIDPEDILQETLLLATRKLGELEVRTHSSILHWLATLADGQIRDRIRYLSAEKRDMRREQRIRLSDDSGEESSSGVIVPFPGPTPSQYFERSELEHLIDAKLEELEPPEYREVVLMRDYYESDWETIRVTLGRPSVGAVQDLYQRAHTRLREHVHRALGDE